MVNHDMYGAWRKIIFSGIISRNGDMSMAKYIVEESNYKKYEKNYLFHFINLVPGIVWSIPFHQKLFPDAGWWMTFGLCTAFVILYWYLSMKPIIAAIPCVAGVIIFTALFWVIPDYIANTPVRIIVKILILAFFVMVELCIWINATLPWLERKFPSKPNIRVIR